MVKLLLDALTAPNARLWIIGQTPQQAAQDVVHLLLRALLLTATTLCG